MSDTNTNTDIADVLRRALAYVEKDLGEYGSWDDDLAESAARTLAEDLQAAVRRAVILEAKGLEKSNVAGVDGSAAPVSA